MWAFLASPIIKNTSWLLLKAFVYAIVILGLTWCVYIAVIRPHTKPNPTSTQTGGYSYHYDVRPTFGCISLPVIKDKK